jgi:ABC-type transport system involved in multi-copper enzyme maturation permease subunit
LAESRVSRALTIGRKSRLFNKGGFFYTGGAIFFSWFLYILMASQKLTNCCVAAIALVTAAYLSTPHSSTIARLAFGAFCLAIHSFCFLAKASYFDSWADGGKRNGGRKTISNCL